MTTATLIGALVALAAFAALAWRYASRRQSLPCPSWLSALVEIDNPIFPATSAREVVRALAVEPGMQVLDAGCGPGRLTLKLAEATGPSGRVVAFDLQPAMLTKVLRKSSAAGLSNIEARSGELGCGGLEPGSFDRIAMAAVLGEVPRQDAVIAELAGALKPGGRLAVSEIIADPHFVRRSKVRALAAAHGLREVRCNGHRLAYTLVVERPIADVGLKPGAASAAPPEAR